VKYLDIHQLWRNGHQPTRLEAQLISQSDRSTKNSCI